MTTPTAPRPSAGQTRAPGAIAPLVREAWYVVAARSEFGRTLQQRWILGEPVCFFEATDGALVVLDDRCAHRRFPLSRSRLDGDVIECGYHGFRYGTDGRCIATPGADPGSIRVRAYPAVQRGPWVWIWTGADPGAADPDLIPWPDHELQGAEAGYVTGYTLNAANYGMLHENLLDLTHFQFLHQIVDRAYAEMAPELLSAAELPPGFADCAVGYRKTLSTALNAMAPPAGEDPTIPVHKTEHAVSVCPAINYGIDWVEPHDADAARIRKAVVAHCITPADASSTHQFWMYWQDVPLAMEPAELAGFIGQVFNQDVEALAWQQEYIERDTRAGVVEDSVPADVPGLRVRRVLRRLADAEQR